MIGRVYLQQALQLGSLAIPKTLTSEEYGMIIENGLLQLTSSKTGEVFGIPLSHVLVVQWQNPEAPPLPQKGKDAKSKK